MAVFRIEKTRDYTVMSNYHLRDRKSLVRNFLHAADETDHKKLVIAGGVSANALLRRRLTEECKRTGRTLYMPDLSLTGDNAAMVGAQAYYEYLAGHTAGMELNACAQRSIDLG